MVVPRWCMFLVPPLLLLLATELSVGIGGARADTPSRSLTVVYVNPNAGVFKAGKHQLGVMCWAVDPSGSMDYTRCCPDGFSPVGISVVGDLACLAR